MAHKPMSIEAVLDEERREVLALLESTATGGRPRGSASSAGGQARTGSPFATPRSPVRSMLDVDPPASRTHSLPGINGGGISSPPIRSMLDVDSPPPVRSMLDISTPLPSAMTSPRISSISPRISNASLKTATASTRSAQSSPTDANHKAALTNSQHPRSLSDAATRPADFGPRAPGFAAPSPYQFSGYLQSNPGGPVVPKRNTQGGKKPQIPSAMAEVVRGGDLTSYNSRDRGRHSTAGTGIGNHVDKSKSPSNRLGLRSNSPHSSMINSDLSKFTLNDGRVIDMNSAYKRLSDANLAQSTGGLSSLSDINRRRRTNSGDAMIQEESGGGRLEKEYTGEDALEDSSDEDHRSSDDEGSRGRKMEKSKQKDDHHPESQTIGMGRAKGPRTAQSLMAAAEEERAEIAAKHQYRSLLDPEITVTEPSGERSKSSRTVVHPRTAFDEASGFNTPVDSDTEADLTDIKRAQKLSVNMTTITSTPATKRSVRTIYRGDFAKMLQEAHDNQRRIRKYLVATDLSDEAAHALEWTIGTVLRDGDTLLAIYCVDEELGIASNDGSADDQLKDQATAVVSSASARASTPVLHAAPAPSPLGHGFRLETSNASASPMGRERGKAEQERHRAVQDITDRVSKLLRKTKLQVKVVIEVIHCKSPKHLITEVIDYLSPTLVILGSRGRSALKGVILGSFSNYLVTKSSVPVMVARKRLRKHTKLKRPNMKLANNLSNPAVKSLVNANIDLPLR